MAIFPLRSDGAMTDSPPALQEAEGPARAEPACLTLLRLWLALAAFGAAVGVLALLRNLYPGGGDGPGRP